MTDVKGTGKDGRVLKEDILSYMKTLSQPQSATSDVHIKPIRGYTKTMIKTMTEAMVVIDKYKYFTLFLFIKYKYFTYFLCRKYHISYIMMKYV